MPFSWFQISGVFKWFHEECTRFENIDNALQLNSAVTISATGFHITGNEQVKMARLTLELWKTVCFTPLAKYTL